MLSRLDCIAPSLTTEAHEALTPADCLQKAPHLSLGARRWERPPASNVHRPDSIHRPAFNFANQSELKTCPSAFSQIPERTLGSWQTPHKKETRGRVSCFSKLIPKCSKANRLPQKDFGATELLRWTSASHVDPPAFRLSGQSSRKHICGEDGGRLFWLQPGCER